MHEISDKSLDAAPVFTPETPKPLIRRLPAPEGVELSVEVLYELPLEEAALQVSATISGPESAVTPFAQYLRTAIHEYAKRGKSQNG